METKWLKSAKIYQIMIDRFAGWDSDYSHEMLRKGFLGGNLLELSTKLDYIKSLGFNAIWLSPFYINASYHGYHIIDYMHVDPRFAFGKIFLESTTQSSNKDSHNTPADEVLINLIESCHEKGIKVIADFVPNHCHEYHPFFLDAISNKKSKYRNWFFINGKNYLKFLSCGELPKFNLDNTKCRDYMISVAKRWLDTGIDAFRIDHCIGPSQEFTKYFHEWMKTNYPNKYLIGECLPLVNYKFANTILGIQNIELLKVLGNEKLNKEYIDLIDEIFLEYDNKIDSLLDFSFMLMIHMFLDGMIVEEELYTMLDKHDEKFKNSNLILCKFLDSHDSDRIFFKCNGDKQKYYTVVKILYDRGCPYIWYYGTEIFMTHKKHIDSEHYGDYMTRLPMNFDS